MSTTPKWAVGMQKLGPGIYFKEDTKQIHVSEAELCEHFGVPYTPENVKIIEEAVREAFPGIATEVQHR